MRKLEILLIPLLVVALVVGAVGCGSSERGSIASFLRDDHTVNVLSKHDEIMANANSVFNESYPRGNACLLAEEALENRNEILQMEPPDALGDFCIQILMSAELLYWALDEFCNYGWSDIVIDDWNDSIQAREDAYSILDDVLAEYNIESAST